MYINRTLLLFLGIALVFLPPIQEWLTTGGGSWYHLYLFWLSAVILAYWEQRSGFRDEL